MNDRAPADGPADPSTREERKRRTREALLQSTLVLLEDQSFSGVSLREVTRAAGVVPTAFYRHFQSMEELGLALVDESFRTLRQMLRDARADTSRAQPVISSSVEILVRHVHENRLHFRFISRERYGGVATLRHAIRGEIRLFASDLATDLARFPYLNTWDGDDLRMMSALIVNTMVSTAEDILELPLGDPEVEREVIRSAERQLLLIAIGVPHWRAAVRATGASGIAAP